MARPYSPGAFSELRSPVPPEVGVPIPLGDAECPSLYDADDELCFTDDARENVNESEWCRFCEGSGRVPVVPTCQTCEGMGTPSAADEYPPIPCPDCTDGVARRWTGTVVVAGACRVCAMVGGPLVRCSTCDRLKPPLGRSVALEMSNGMCSTDCGGYRSAPVPEVVWPGEVYGESLGHMDWHAGTFPDRRFHVEGDVVPVEDIDGDELPDTLGWGVVLYIRSTDPAFGVLLTDRFQHPPVDTDVTAAFPVPPAVGTWAVVPDTIEET